MIVPMKKITFVGIESEKERFLEALQDVGLTHIILPKEPVICGYTRLRCFDHLLDALLTYLDFGKINSYEVRSLFDDRIRFFHLNIVRYCSFKGFDFTIELFKMCLCFLALHRVD